MFMSWKIPFLGREIVKSNDLNKVNKRLEELENDSVVRPIQEAYSLMHQDGGLVPLYTTDITKREMQDLARISSVYRQVVSSLQWELFRRGAEFKPNFVRKCTNVKCEREFDSDFEVCPDCKSKTREPDFTGVAAARNKFKRVNDNGDSLIDVFKQLEFDFDTVDDTYLCISKNYEYNASGEIITSSVNEMFRIKPDIIHIIADKKLRMGRNEAGKRVFMCPVHRNKVLIEKTVCHCGNKAYPAYYKTIGETGEESIYYMDKEIIHNSKFNPSLVYGFPPFLSLYQKVMIELNMDWYVKKSYEKGRGPNTWTFVKTANTEGLKTMIEYYMDKLKLNPHFNMPIGIPTDTAGQFVQQVKLLDSMQEMQAVEYRNAIKREIGALFGVMPLFQGDMSTGGGLNNEGLQVTVTNRAVEVGQGIYNEKISPLVMLAFGVEDFSYELLPSEEKDQVAELQIEGLKIDNMMKMLSAGYDVDLSEEGEFEYSGTAEKPEVTSDFNVPDTPGISEQRFSGEPQSSTKIKKGRLPKATKGLVDSARVMTASFEEELKKLINKMDWKNKPNKIVLAKRVNVLTKLFKEKIKSKSNKSIELAYKKAMDEVEKELGVNFLFGEVDKNAISVLSNSKVLSSAYNGMTVSMSKKINEVIDKAYKEPEMFSMDKIVSGMKAAADEEEFSLRRIARTETTKVSNIARQNSYLQADKENKFKYKWLGPNDSRVTKTCKRIKDRTKNGVSLSKLKEIVEEESKKDFPEFKSNGLIAHYDCRHTFVKVV